MSNVVLKHVREDNREPYHYKGCGLPNIILLSGYSVEEFDSELSYSVKDVYALHKAIGRVIATKAGSLTPAEVRFLRDEMNLTQLELGLLMGVSSQAVARYEKGKTGIGGPAERLLRALYLRHLNEEIDIIELAEYLSQLDESPSDNIALAYNGKWAFKEAACG